MAHIFVTSTQVGGLLLRSNGCRPAPTCTAVTVSTYSTPTMTGCKTQYKKSFGGQVYDTCGECQMGYYLDNPNATTISSPQCSNTVKSIGCTGSCTGDGTTGWSCTGEAMGNWCTWRHRVVVNGQCQGENYFTCAEGFKKDTFYKRFS